MQRGKLAGGAKRTYVSTMRVAHPALRRLHLVQPTPPPRERRLAHWWHSLTEVHNPAALIAMDVPWWTYRAIDAVEEWIRSRPSPPRVFEYGAGASSVWLARRAAEVHSVEHHEGFWSAMTPSWTPFDNLAVALVPPIVVEHPTTPSAKEGYEGMDFTAYVRAIERLDDTFDLIVIDGRARHACLKAAIARLADDGLIVFDNSSRHRYRRAIAQSGLVERPLSGLVPTLPYRDQTSLLSRL